MKPPRTRPTLGALHDAYEADSTTEYQKAEIRRRLNAGLAGDLNGDWEGWINPLTGGTFQEVTPNERR